MDHSSLLKAYNKLNGSFRRKFVYRIGRDYGFFSEYNNMILAMLYCLKYQYKFTLSSQNSSLSNIGWIDFFLPFCPENKYNFHLENNFRSYVKVSKKRGVFIKGYKVLIRKRLTQDFWAGFHSRDFEQEFFDIGDLHINGTTPDAAKTLVDLTWRFNKTVKAEIDSLLQTIKLPDNYIGLHIRRGDKITEAPEVPIDEYIKKAATLAGCKCFFVATDDYSVIEYMQQSYPELKFYHLTKTEDRGYDQNTFASNSPDKKREELIRFFAAIEVLSGAEYFIGTFNSNIGMFMRMRLGKERVYAVDRDEWLIW